MYVCVKSDIKKCCGQHVANEIYFVYVYCLLNFLKINLFKTIYISK